MQTLVVCQPEIFSPRKTMEMPGSTDAVERGGGRWEGGGEAISRAANRKGKSKTGDKKGVSCFALSPMDIVVEI